MNQEKPANADTARIYKRQAIAERIAEIAMKKLVKSLGSETVGAKQSEMFMLIYTTSYDTLLENDDLNDGTGSFDL